MGVLRVNDGTALLPDWRNVGCGGAAATVMTYPTATNTVTIYADNAGTMYGYTNRLTGSGIAHLDMNIDSAQHTFVYQSGDVNGGHAIFTCSIAGSWIGTAVSNAYWRTSSDSFIGFGNWTPSTVQAYTAATTGRLKLWDGTRWMRETCDSDAVATTVVSPYTWTTLPDAANDPWTLHSTASSESSQHGVDLTYISSGGTPGTGTGAVARSGSSGSFNFVAGGGASIPPGATLTGVNVWSGTGPFSGTVIASWTSPERHPLKMWDGTTWQTVACLTPA